MPPVWKTKAEGSSQVNLFEFAKIRCQVNQIYSRNCAADILAALSLLLTAAIVSWVLWYCRLGFDITDESFYLNWISRPHNYTLSNTQFGFLYHPLYLLLDGNIAALRQTNLLVTFLLGGTATWFLIRRAFGDVMLNITTRVAIAAAFATGVLHSAVFLGMWLPTPSYNSLTYQGLLVTTIGLSLADKTMTRRSTTGWTLIGIGGWLTFLGKPSSAAALAALCIIYLLLSRQVRIRQLATAAATALTLLVFTALLIDGSITGFISRNVEGVKMAKLLAGDVLTTQIFRLEDLNMAEATRVAMYSLGGIVFVAMWLVRWESRTFPASGLWLSIIFATLASLAVFGYIPLQTIAPEHRGLLFLSIGAGLAAGGLSMFRRNEFTQTSWPILALCLSVLAMPYVYAFGSGNNYWIPIGTAAGFVAIAGIALLAPLTRHSWLGSALVSTGVSLQLVVVILVNGAFDSPYRQPHPLSRNEVILEVGMSGSELILSEPHARYLSSLIDAASRNGFQRGKPMIDLSGHSPGVLYALGANSIGLAWTLGGYPGTAQFVIRGLQDVPCDQLAEAWTLSEPKGPRAVPAEVLASFGAASEADYQIVGEFKSPEGQVQYLSKPTRDMREATSVCEAVRAKIK